MKRSKVFLSVTSGLLAVAGVAAAKAHHFSSIAGAYTNNTGICISAGPIAHSATSPLGPARTLSPVFL